MNYDELNRKLKQLKAEDFIWLIYIGIIIMSWYSNSLERKYFIYNDCRLILWSTRNELYYGKLQGHRTLSSHCNSIMDSWKSFPNYRWSSNINSPWYGYRTFHQEQNKRRERNQIYIKENSSVGRRFTWIRLEPECNP